MNDVNDTKNLRLLKRLHSRITDSSFSEEKINEEIICPVSPAQLDFWKIEKDHNTHSVFNLSFSLKLKGKLEVKSLEKSFKEIIARHQPFRTKFFEINGKVKQVILPELKDFTLNIEAIKKLSDIEIENYIYAYNNQKISLSHAPLFRIKLLNVNKDYFILLIVIHHIIFDGWSLTILYNEINELYNSFITKQKSKNLPILEYKYHEFLNKEIEWLKTSHADQQFAYWKNKLYNPPNVKLNFMQDTLIRDFTGRTIRFSLEENLVYIVKLFSSKYRSTSFAIVLTVLFLMLKKYSENKDITLGVPVARRNSINTENMIGYFTNTLTLRNKFEDDITLLSLLKQIYDNYLEALSNQDYPFEELVNILNPVTPESRTPYFQIMLIYQYTEYEHLYLKNLEVEPIEVECSSSEFEMTFWVQDYSKTMDISCIYNHHLFSQSSMLKFTENFRILLQTLCENPNLYISEALNTLSIIERVR